MRNYALTYPQLMQQAIRQGMSEAELAVLKRAYAVAEDMLDGFYRGQGAPFITHLVRTASIVLAEHAPIDVVVAALLHAVYLLGQFEDGRQGRATPAHRAYVRSVVGDAAEGLIETYDRIPWANADTLRAYVEQAATADASTRYVWLMHIANNLEDFLDQAMVFRGRMPYEKLIEDYGREVISLAKALGYAQLADELAVVFNQHLNTELPALVRREHCHAYEHVRRQWQKKDVLARVRMRCMRLLPFMKKR